MKRFIDIIFSIFLFIIVLVSVLDTYLNLKYPVTSSYEHNPLAKLVLIYSGENLPLLISIKFFGTCLALAFLIVYYNYSRVKAFIVAFIIAAVQFVFMLVITGGLCPLSLM